MKRIKAPHLALAIVGALALVLPLAQAADPMARQYAPNLSLDACQATAKLADFLVSQQVPEDGGWTWRIGDQAPSANMAGLVSLALLDAHRVTAKRTHLRAAQRQADGYLARPYKGLPYKSDVELMVRLYGLFDDPTYESAARELFERIRARSPNGAAEVARIAAGRKATPALLGYDVAMAIRAALAVDERRYAYALADALIAKSGSWYRPGADPRFTLISAAALVSALESLDEAQYRRTIAKFRTDLARAQAENGAWLNNETQATAQAAYALLYSPVAAEREAAQRGVRWLISTLLQGGSLATFNDHMPEPFVGEVFSGVNAEALTLLSAACEVGRQGK